MIRYVVVILAFLLVIHVAAHNTSTYQVGKDNDTERLALTRLYNYTGGSTWTNQTNWLNASASVCTWYGISCIDLNNTYHVVNIQLPSNNLNGALVVLSNDTSLLCDFPHLQYLNLAYNPNLSGSLPDFSCLTQLRILNLSSCSFYDIVPNFSSNHELLSLSLDNNQLWGNMTVTWIHNLTSLYQVNIANNINIFDIFPPFLNNPSLLELDVSNCSFYGVFPSISSLSSLRILDVSYNYFTNLPDFTENQELHTILADGNGLLSFPPGLPNSLITLSLPYNNLTGSIPSYTLELPLLVNLDLSYNYLTGELPNFTLTSALYEIDLECNHFYTSNPIWPDSLIIQPLAQITIMCYDAPYTPSHNCSNYCNTTYIYPPDSSSSSNMLYIELGIGIGGGIIVLLVVILVVKRCCRSRIVKNDSSINNGYRAMA